MCDQAPADESCARLCSRASPVDAVLLTRVTPSLAVIKRCTEHSDTLSAHRWAGRLRIGDWLEIGDVRTAPRSTTMALLSVVPLQTSAPVLPRDEDVVCGSAVLCVLVCVCARAALSLHRPRGTTTHSLTPRCAAFCSGACPRSLRRARSFDHATPSRECPLQLRSVTRVTPPPRVARPLASAVRPSPRASSIVCAITESPPPLLLLTLFVVHDSCRRVRVRGAD